MTFRVFLLIALAAFPAASCASPASDATPQEPASEFEKIPLSVGTVLEITDGDFVHPAFSPDGKKLAYSGVVVQENTELTEIFVRELESGETARLLGADKSSGYAVYKSFVIGLEWKDNNTLVAEISDGDVDSTAVTFDVTKRKILSEEFSSEDDRIPALSPLGRRAKATFTQWPEGVLGSALNQPLIRIGSETGPDAGPDVGPDASNVTPVALVVQKRHAGEDDHIWRLDFPTGEITKLMDVPEQPLQRLVGGTAKGDAILFALRQGSQVRFYEYRDGEVTELGKISTKEGGGWVDVKFAVWSHSIFLLRRHASYERGHNPLFLYDASGLREVEVPGDTKADLYDAAVSPDGNLLCLVLWRDDQRHLLVLELPDRPQH